MSVSCLCWRLGWLYGLLTERIQLIFNNRGNRDSAWHSYSLNDFDDGKRAEFHVQLRERVAEGFKQRTFATPGMPNSPDYSGNISTGTFE